MPEHITGFQTEDGVKKYDYNALANLPLIPSISGCANALIGTASGAVVRVNDVSPIEHKIGCKVRSKNLFNDTDDYKGYEYSYSDRIITISGRYIHKYILLEEGKTYTFSCKSTRTGTDGGGIYIRGYTEDKVGYVDLSAASLINQLSPTVTVTMPKGYPYIRLAFYGFFDAEGSGTATYTDIMLEEGAEATGYVPYVDVSTTTITRCGKNIIPYPYHEATITKNGITFTINSNGSITINGTATAAAVFYLSYIKNIGETVLQSGTNSSLNGTVTNGVCVFSGGAMYNANHEAVILNIPKDETVDNVTVFPQVEYGTEATEYEIYKGGEIYTPDTDGTVEGVTSISPAMTLLSDTANTVIECEYARDVGAVLTELINRGGGSSRISEVTILANKWVGTASPYSQVVTVAGVTENTQVDLTPSVEQLAVFHNKDLAFVTENEGGVVTVYAVGEKPTNDYTIQATLTEVNV